MAERRMFARTITESDAFLDMPLSSQALYFHLGMHADDDGFVGGPKRIQRTIGATADDLNLLLAKRFIIAFPSGVVVVKHWRINNYIQKDRYHETAYRDEYEALVENPNRSYALKNGGDAVSGLPPACIQDVSNLDAQTRLDETRLDEKRDTLSGKPDPAPIVREVIEYLNEKTGKHFKASTKATGRHITARVRDGYALDDFKRVIDAKAAQWGNDSKMSAYLRPETLFGPKFEGYLNEGGVRRDDYSQYNC